MRIAVIAPPWVPVPPPAYGGTEVVLDGLCRGLTEAGHEVLLYASGDSTCPVARDFTFELAPGVESISPAAELRHVIRGYDAVRDFDADVVHDHTLVGPVYAERFPELRVATTNHGPFNGDLDVLYRALADRVPVVAISHSQASTAPDIPIAAVIHHGVDPARFPVGSGAGGYALFLGRMVPEKGVHTAIRAARAAGVPLLIAAKMREQHEYEYFTERVKPLLGGDVEYVGEVGGDRKLQFLGDAACLLNPVAWPEPFGMVMIEALACGTPVVATPCGATSEIVEEGVTGFLRSDEDVLAAAVENVGELDRAACRAAVEERFSHRRMANDHVALYERIAAPSLRDVA
ncbi:MAG: glycosyltransferase family 4 protein [Actinomycetota bacterium]|nr:glycosyltransferase family 4 protein [Actinomycetota bacterium]